MREDAKQSETSQAARRCAQLYSKMRSAGNPEDCPRTRGVRKYFADSSRRPSFAMHHGGAHRLSTFAREEALIHCGCSSVLLGWTSHHRIFQPESRQLLGYGVLYLRCGHTTAAAVSKPLLGWCSSNAKGGLKMAIQSIRGIGCPLAAAHHLYALQVADDVLHPLLQEVIKGVHVGLGQILQRPGDAIPSGLNVHLGHKRGLHWGERPTLLGDMPTFSACHPRRRLPWTFKIEHTYIRLL